MKSTETLPTTYTESLERSADVFDTAAAEMGHYALIAEQYAVENQLEELTTTTSESRDKMKDLLDSQEGGPQATRNRMIGLGFQAERAQRKIAMLEQKKQGIEAVFDTPNAIDIHYTPSSTEIQVLHLTPASDTEHFDRAA